MSLDLYTNIAANQEYQMTATAHATETQRATDKELLQQFGEELRRMLTLQRREQYVAVEERLEDLSEKIQRAVRDR